MKRINYWNWVGTAEAWSIMVSILCYVNVDAEVIAIQNHPMFLHDCLLNTSKCSNIKNTNNKNVYLNIFDTLILTQLYYRL